MGGLNFLCKFMENCFPIPKGPLAVPTTPLETFIQTEPLLSKAISGAPCQSVCVLSACMTVPQRCVHDRATAADAEQLSQPSIIPRCMQIDLVLLAMISVEFSR